LAVAVLLAIVSAAAPAPALAFPPSSRTALLTLLDGLAGQHVLSGQHNREPNADPTKYTRVAQQIAGQTPGLWGGDFLFLPEDVQHRQTMVDEAIRQWRAGSVVALTWHMCPPTVSSTCTWNDDILRPLRQDQWDELVTNGTPLNTAYRKRLDEAVPYLRQLQDAGVPVLWRPIHEMNDGWSWWGGRSGPDGSRKLYEITYDHLTGAKGLSNLVWVWNIKDVDMGAAGGYLPDRAKFDVASLDVWVKMEPSSSDYQTILDLAAGKPISLAEVGRVPSPALMDAQPRWTWWMVWAEWLTDPAYNNNSAVQESYRSPRVFNRGEFQITVNSPLKGAAGKCVDVPEANSANGARVQLWTCNGTPAQQWTAWPDGTLRALGKCLDVAGGARADGTPVQLWDCTPGNANQQWSYNSTTQALVNPRTAKCLDATGQSATDGTKLQIWSCHGQPNQRWTPPAPTRAEAAGPITGLGGKCVDVAESNTTNGTRVQLYTCNGTAAQRWTIGADETIRAMGKCLDVPGGANGTKVRLWDCVDNEHQRWTSSAQSLLNPETGTCLDATNQSSVDTTPLQIWDCHNQPNQQWALPGTSSCARTAPVGESKVPVVFNGMRYDVTVYVPPNVAARAPAVLNLHGTSGTGSGQLWYSDLKSTADTGGFLVVAPEGAIRNGSGYAWNVPNVGNPPAGARDDVAFLAQVITTTTTTLCADPTRIYATGYSGGGRMTSAFACARPTLVAAIAPVAGLRAGRPNPTNSSSPDPASCKPPATVPVIAFHGRQDATNPFDGGGTDLWRYSVPQAQQRWSTLNGCANGPTTDQVSAHVRKTTYDRCRDEANVVLYEVSDGGHTWPGTPRPSTGNGNTTHEINANALMWQFFLAHQR
jgi:poly(3-hydroxybutyrate) depolymerase